MSQNDFTVRARFLHVLSQVFGAVVWVSFATWITLGGIIPAISEVAAEANYSGMIVGGLLLALMCFGAISSVFVMCNSIIRRYEVQDDCIDYRSLFRRKEFTFDDIERIELVQLRFWYIIKLSSNWRIYLHREKRWLEIPVKSINIDLFFECLRDRNIPVIGKL